VIRELRPDMMSHFARAVFAEPFRREGVFTLAHLGR
jgi:hypothetical protein